MRNFIFVLTYLLSFSQIQSRSFFHLPDSTDIETSLSVNDASTPYDTFDRSAKGKEQNIKSAPKINKIVLDAGHGGKDPGCSGAYSKEKNITLAIVKKAGALIKARYPDIEIVYTRDKDVFIPLNERANIANKQKADLFISVHCNAVPNGAHVKGSETYVLGLHRAKENLDVAKRENAAVVLEENYTNNYGGFDPNSDEGYIILSMYQSAYLERSMQFAALVEQHMVKKTGRRSYGVKQAGFVVLWATAMPSILIETGYLTNSEEETLLSSEAGQQEFAGIILAAIDDYIGGVQPTTSNSDVADKKTTPQVEKTQPVNPQQIKPTVVKNVSKPSPANITDNQVVFKIQLSASPSEMNISSGIWTSAAPIEQVFENNMYKYLSGSFKTLSEASSEKIRLKSLGFNDAFVVAYRGSNRISLEEAKK